MTRWQGPKNRLRYLKGEFRDGQWVEIASDAAPEYFDVLGTYRLRQWEESDEVRLVAGTIAGVISYERLPYRNHQGWGWGGGFYLLDVRHLGMELFGDRIMTVYVYEEALRTLPPLKQLAVAGI